MSGRRSTSGSGVATRIEALERLGYQELRAEWRRLYRVDPPERLSRDVLRVGVAWKIQAHVHGGLRPVTKRQLDSLAAMSVPDPPTAVATAPSDLPDAAPVANRDEEGSRYTVDRSLRLKPGTKLIREWHGETHTVVVLEEGYEWNGAQWRSLSVIARAISGSHWSGPRFFGLKGRREPGPSAEFRGAKE